MNGCTVSEFEILAVYNDMDRCIGFHEDTHIISYQLCSPQSEFLLEGLACCMEQLWWGIDNLAWTAYYFKNALLPPVADMFDNEAFASVDCFISYPAAGAFVQYLMLRFGMERFLRFYSAVDESCTDGAEHIFGYPLKVLEHDFCQYLELMWYDEAVTARIRQLLSSCGIE